MISFTTRYSRWAICAGCEGNGKVENPAFSNGFTSEEWSEMCEDRHDDGETAASRYLSGIYDVLCGGCKGNGKVREPDFQAMPRPERRAYVQFLRRQRAEAEFERECAAERDAERRMGC